MKLALLLAVLAAFGLDASAAEGPERPAAKGPEMGGALREVSSEKQERLRDRRLHVAVKLKDGSRIAGVLESYTPGKGDLPGTFVLTVEGGKPRALYDIEAARIEVVRAEAAEPAKDEPPPHAKLLPELAKAVRAGKLPAFIEEHEAALRKASNIPDARAELVALAAAYWRRQPELDRKQLRERLKAQVNGVENGLVRVDLHRALQEERILMGRPLRPNGGRGLGPGGPREPEQN